MTGDLQPSGPVVLLAGPGDSTWIVANALHRALLLDAVLLEPSASRLGMIRRRAHRLGWVTVGGQLAFLPLAGVLRRRSAARIDQICRHYDLDRRPPSDVPVVAIPSVNDRVALQELLARQPSVVVVNGTRIIASHVLEAVEAPFINMHAGITPAYRGIHGGYRALAQGDADNFGVTVHLVDAGVDTGQIISQVRACPGPLDNFATYPYLQVAAGVPALVNAVDAARMGVIQVRQTNLPSQLWSHPTLAEYLHGWRRGIR